MASTCLRGVSDLRYCHQAASRRLGCPANAAVHPARNRLTTDLLRPQRVGRCAPKDASVMRARRRQRAATAWQGAFEQEVIQCRNVRILRVGTGKPVHPDGSLARIGARPPTLLEQPPLRVLRRGGCIFRTCGDALTHAVENDARHPWNGFPMSPSSEFRGPKNDRGHPDFSGGLRSSWNPACGV